MTSPNLIQETNIENILQENLWKEIRLLDKKSLELTRLQDELSERRMKLHNIALAAGIHEPEDK